MNHQTWDNERAVAAVTLQSLRASKGLQTQKADQRRQQWGADWCNHQLDRWQRHLLKKHAAHGEMRKNEKHAGVHLKYDEIRGSWFTFFPT